MLWMLTAAGCAGCLPLGESSSGDSAAQYGNDPPIDTAETGDTAGGEDSADTAPLVVPRCSMEIVENDDPGDDGDELAHVPLSTYACGIVDRTDDYDFLTFSTTEPGWVEVDVQAESRGSFADMTDRLAFLDGDDAVSQYDRCHGVDPISVFYAAEPGDYLSLLNEASRGSGEDYGWWYRASMTKAPVAFEMIEVEPNDDEEGAQSALPDTRYYGTFGTGGDGDWFLIDLPPEATWLTLDTDAYEFGSAADVDMQEYWGGPNHYPNVPIANDHLDDESGCTDASYEFDIVTRIKASDNGVILNDDLYDVGGNDYSKLYIHLYNATESQGSNFHWYVFSYHLSTEIK